MENDQLLLNEDFKKRSRLRLIIFISIIIVLLALVVCFIILYVQEKNKTDNNSDEGKKDSTDGNSDYHVDIPLPSWNDCTAKTKLSEFISKINSVENYVPKEDRIAVFDLDGTLYQETDPTYDDWKLYYYRVYNDSNYTATEEQKKSLMILKSRRKKM